MTKMGAKAWSDPVKSGPILNRIPLGRFAGKYCFRTQLLRVTVVARVYVIRGGRRFITGGEVFFWVFSPNSLTFLRLHVCNNAYDEFKYKTIIAVSRVAAANDENRLPETIIIFSRIVFFFPPIYRINAYGCDEKYLRNRY